MSQLIGLFRLLYLRLTERLYTDWSPLYEFVAWLVSFGQWDRWRQSANRHIGAGRTLEVGSGTGRLLDRLAQTGVDVSGLDRSPQMAARSANRLRNRGLSAPFVQASAHALPFLDATFDNVVSTFPAHYILDPNVLDECCRILTPGQSGSTGRLVIVGLWVEPDLCLLQWLGFVFYGRPSHEFLGQYAALLQEKGLSPAFMDTHIWRFRVGTVLAVN